MSRLIALTGLPLACAALALSPGIGAPQLRVAPTQTEAATSLGDLSSFRAIASDTLRIVQGGDLSAAKNRIKDLETAWDADESKMRPLNPGQWRVVDKAIDRVLENLRAGVPGQAACAESLESLIATMDSIDRKGG
jgi:hypothetical protein